MIITVGGEFGSGKTTLAAALAQALGYDELKVGIVMRRMAMDRHIGIDAFQEQLKNDPELEKSVDAEQARMMAERDNLIVQSRLAWFFASHSPFQVLRVLLTVDPAVGAKRTGTKMENLGKTPEQVLAMNAERRRIETERFRALYAIDNYLDPSHYDLVIDTTNATAEENLRAVLAKAGASGANR